MLDIKIKTVKDVSQRYNTVGDYFTNSDGQREFRVSDMGDWRLEILTALHELVESSLCQARGVSDEMIDVFDIDYESKRPSGDVSEPGDSPEAPYYDEHQFANKIERMMAGELGVNWDEYVKIVDDLTLK